MHHKSDEPAIVKAQQVKRALHRLLAKTETTGFINACRISWEDELRGKFLKHNTTAFCAGECPPDVCIIIPKCA